MKALITTCYSLGLLKTGQESKYALFKLTHTHTHGLKCARHTSTQIKDRGETCSGKMDWCVTQLTKQQGLTERTEQVDDTAQQNGSALRYLCLL